jgi:hypothetical protein
MIASHDFVPLSNGRYGWALDVSSINATDYIALIVLDLSSSGTIVRRNTIKELWLE